MRRLSKRRRLVSLRFPSGMGKLEAAGSVDNSMDGGMDARAFRSILLSIDVSRAS
jgi:hypothetical protein